MALLRLNDIGQNKNRCPTRGPITLFSNHETRHFSVDNGRLTKEKGNCQY
jgi:hypothetical protein